MTVDNDFYKCCKYCRNFMDGECLDSESFNIVVDDEMGNYVDSETSMVHLEINNPETFVCANWR